MRDRRLIGVGIAAAVVDRTEHRRRVVGIHERARAVVDRLAGDRHVVGVHHAMDEADAHPAATSAAWASMTLPRNARYGCSARPRPGNGGRSCSRQVAATSSWSPEIAAYWKVPTRMWLAATRVRTAPGSASRGKPLRRCRHRERPGGGDAERVHRLADNVFAQHRAEGGLAVAAARKRGAARALE